MGLSAEKRMKALEERLERYRQRMPGRPCAHCDDGWIREETDVLRCDSCGYLRYL